MDMVGHVRMHGERLLLILLIAVPGVSIMASARLGVGLQGDSYPYLAAAGSVSEQIRAGNLGGAFLDSAAGFVHWPIGFPMWISLHSLMGISPVLWSLLSNVALSGLLVWLTYRLALLAGLTTDLSLVSAAFVSLSPAMVEVGWRVQTEALFSAIFLGSVILLARSVKMEALSWRRVVALSGLVSSAYLIRYMGAFLFPAVLLAVTWIAYRNLTKSQIVRISVLCFGSSLGILLQGIRNIHHGAEFLGSDRYVQRFTTGEVVSQALPWVGSYWWPQRNLVLSLLASCLVLGLVLAALVRAFKTRTWAVVYLFFVWIGFWLLLLGSIYYQDTSPVDWRFIHPVFPISAVLVVGGSAFLIRRVGRPRARLGKPSLVAASLQSRTFMSLMFAALLVVMAARLATEVVDPQGSGATDLAPLMTKDLVEPLPPL